MRLLSGEKLVLAVLILASSTGSCGKESARRESEAKDLESDSKAKEAARILEEGPPTSPIDAAVQVDTSREINEIVSPSGGTLRVTGADGTKFTLEFPKGAVPDSKGVAMTPVDSLSDLPFSAGLVGAVQLEPEGLVLSAPATLTIEPAKPTPLKNQIAFGAASNGEGVYLAPLTPRTEQTRMAVVHFSVYGSVESARGAVVYQNGVIEWKEGFWPTPKTLVDRVYQEYAKYAHDMVILNELGYESGSPTFDKAYDRAIGRIRAARFLYLQDLVTRLKTAASDCQDFEAAFNVMLEYSAFEKNSEHLGYGGTEASLLPLMKEVMDKCAHRAWERCRAGEIPGGLEMVMIFRYYAVLEWDSPYTDEQWKDREKCPPIKLVIEDNNDIELELFSGIVGMPNAIEHSHHVYRGYLYQDKDSVWRGGLDVSVEGSYSTIDEKATDKRVKELTRGKQSFEAGVTSIFEIMKFLGNEIPSCKGKYTGKQSFSIEGSFTTGDQGQDQVELAFSPVRGPDFYRSSPECPWVEENRIRGVKVIPTHLVKDQATAIVIDPPQLGAPAKKYVIPVQGEGIRRETIIIVGGK